MVLLWKLECFAVCWEFKLCLAIIYKLKGGKRGENFGNIASISQPHLFYIIFHILHTLLAALPSQWLFIGLILLSEVLNSIFGSVLRLKKQKKWPKSGKIEPVYPATTFHKIYIDISLCMGCPAGELLFLGGSFAFKLYAIHQQFLRAFKGPTIYGST